MPGGDRTGPGGKGPRTGRALGYCSGSDSPGYMNPAPGYGGGFGGGRGGGRGRRNIFRATGLPRWARGGRGGEAGDLESLRREAGVLEARLRSVIERIEGLEKDPGKDNG